MYAIGVPSVHPRAGAGNTAADDNKIQRNTVHPRGRGEHRTIIDPATFADGSSPRARGTLRCCGCWLLVVRFIPAGAGNTGRIYFTGGYRAVHPRGRGEHGSIRTSTSSITGSSPRARGTREHPDKHIINHRFIPAGAGNTFVIVEMRLLVGGSSPRARGTRRSATGFVSFFTVHPRGRGEHGWAAIRSSGRGGSSPRARGTLCTLPIASSALRFIPAGAGNTPTDQAPRRHSSGSSPRARGTPLRSSRWYTDARHPVHPRGRGEHSAARAARPVGIPVHPRGRGEHRRPFSNAAMASGSSPRARGTRKPIDCRF